MISIDSFLGPKGCNFGGSQKKILNFFGEPKKRRKNRERSEEFHYDGFIIRFNSDTLIFEEITILPYTKFKINGQDMLWDYDSFIKIVRQDSNPRVAFGFVILFDLGIACTGFHDQDVEQQAIHFFRENDWDMFKLDSVPF